MKAYSQGISKKDFVREMKWHKEADDFVRGTYDNGGTSGCSVGCALKSVAKLKNISLNYNQHSEFETHLGIPTWLARLNDRIFENCSKERMKSWPVEFAEAINEGADLEKIKVPFLIIVLQSAIDSIQSRKVDQALRPRTYEAIQKSTEVCFQTIEALNSGDPDQLREARTAADAAADAAYAVYAADAAAAYAAADAANAAAAAAYAYAAADADAADAVYAADAAAAAAAAAANAAADFDYFADELLELMRGCK